MFENEVVGNRAQVIRLASLSGLCPMQCRKSGTIMFSNGRQAVFIPEKREFCKDEETASIVSICNANGLGKQEIEKYVGLLEEENQVAYKALGETLISKFSHENENSRDLRVDFVDGLTSSQMFSDLLNGVGLSRKEILSVVDQLLEDSRQVKFAEKIEEQENQR